MLFMTEQIERAIPRHDREPGLGLGRRSLERPGRQRLQQRMLHSVLGNGDAARTQPPRQSGDETVGRIARQRGDEVVDGSAQPDAFA